MEHRVKQMRLNHMYRIYNDCCPEYMRDNFIQVSEVHSYSTRHSLYNFNVPSVYNISKSTFYFNAVQDWNQLPENIKNKKTLVGRNTFLSSPHLCFIIVFICDLFVSRDDPLMS